MYLYSRCGIWYLKLSGAIFHTHPSHVPSKCNDILIEIFFFIYKIVINITSIFSFIFDSLDSIDGWLLDESAAFVGIGACSIILSFIV